MSSISLVTHLGLFNNTHWPLLQKRGSIFVACAYVYMAIKLISTLYRIHWPCSFIQLQSKPSRGNIRELFNPSCAKESTDKPSDTYRWWSRLCQALAKCSFSSLCCCPIGKEIRSHHFGMRILWKVGNKKYEAWSPEFPLNFDRNNFAASFWLYY